MGMGQTEPHQDNPQLLILALKRTCHISEPTKGPPRGVTWTWKEPHFLPQALHELLGDFLLPLKGNVWL